MRVFALILVLTIGTAAHAEKVKTNQSTKLYSRPGEQAKVLLKVKSGQGMTIVGKEGRWLKVRVQGRTGYVPRSKVDMPDDDEIVRNTRRRPFVDGRSTKRGFGGDQGPDDRVGADATGEGRDEPEAKVGSDDEDQPPTKPHRGDDDEDKPPKKLAHKADDEDKPPKKPAHKADDEEAKPRNKPAHKGDDEPTVVDDETGDGGGDSEGGEKVDERPIAHVTEKTKVFSERDPESDPAFTAKPSEVLYPTETKGKWTMVETEEGDAGWVMSSMLDVDDGGGGGGGGTRKRTIDVHARLGVAFISQGLRSTGGTGPLDNYNIGTSAISLALGGGILLPYKKNYVVGGELAYDYNKAAPGIFYDPDGRGGPMPGVNIGVTFHNLNLRGMAGYDFHKKTGMILLARLGYHYQSFLVDNYMDFTKNQAKLPSEVFKAPEIGVALMLPKLTDKIGIRASLDLLFAGSVTQTTNLEDGKSPSASGFDLGALFSYAWKDKMSLQGTYDLNYAGYSFGAPAPNSLRGHTGTNVSRTDIFHTVTFGITYGF